MSATNTKASKTVRYGNADEMPPAPPLSKAVKAAWAARKKGDKLRFLKQALAKSDKPAA